MFTVRGGKCPGASIFFPTGQMNNIAVLSTKYACLVTHLRIREMTVVWVTNLLDFLGPGLEHEVT